MEVQSMVQELTQVCMGIRRDLTLVTQREERERIIMRHIESFVARDIRINDFQAGLEWFNVAEGLSAKKHLAGKVVIMDFFTYCCINCMHVLPDLEAVEKEFTIEDGLVIIGVHSAKFLNERDSSNILSAVQRFDIAHPVVNDAKLSMWRDLGITCWPSLVMIGPNSQLLMVLVGEGHREEIFLYVKVALAYFKSRKDISDHSLPLRPARHLLAVSKDTLQFPSKLAIFDSEEGEMLVVSDTGNNRVLVMYLNGKVKDIIGGCNPGFKDGDFEGAKFNAPQGICTSAGTIIYVADNENHAVRKIDLARKRVTTVAGTGFQGHDYIGGKLGTQQALSSPWDVGMYYQEHGNGSIPVLIIAQAGTHQIWAFFLEDTTWWNQREYKAKTCAAIVGSGREENRNNSYPHAAGLAQPSGLAVVQEHKAVFFADSESSAVRRVDLETGRVSALCGAAKDPTDLHSFGDIDGARYDAKLQHPLGITWHPLDKEVYVADTYNHKIKKVNLTSGRCTTVCGAGKPRTAFQFNEPSGLAFNSRGEILYVADTNNHSVKAIDLSSQEIFTILVNPTEGRSIASRESDGARKFSTRISADGGQLQISFELVLESSTVSSLAGASHGYWTVVLPKEAAWLAKATTGGLDTPISINVSKGHGPKELSIYLEVLICKPTECIPKRLPIVYVVHQLSDGPSSVIDRQRLILDQ